jgi:hypothetical protein
VLHELEAKLRTNFAQHLYLLEAIIYVLVGLLLALAAAGALMEAGAILWRGVARRTFVDVGLLALDQLLLVLMLVEILHTVRISIRSQELMMVPFLTVGLIASIRRVLVITAQAAKMTQEGHDTANAASTFNNAMIELGVLGVLILVFVASIHFLRRSPLHGMIQENADGISAESS